MTRCGYHEIAKTLRSELSAGKYPPESMLPSARLLAGEYGVSVLTANRALGLLVEENYLYRVRGSGTFVRGATTKKRFVIGYCESADTRINDPAYHASMGTFTDHGMEELRKRKVAFRFINYADIVHGEAHKVFAGMDALLISKTFLDERTHDKFERFSGIKVVYRSNELLPGDFHMVLPDPTDGMGEAVKEFLTGPFQKFRVIHADAEHGELRRDWFMRALQLQHVPEESVEIIRMPRHPGDQGRFIGYQMGLKHAMEWRGKNIFCCSDFYAFGILDALRAKGMEAPKDFRLIGFDNLEEYGLHVYSEPTLSTIDDQKNSSAVEAVNLAIRLLEKRENCRQAVFMPMTFVKRKTS